MNAFTPATQAAGFALAEALVALLLLATATTGAGAAMVHSLAGQRAAVQRTRAADLAADLAEALRSAPDAQARQAEILAWQATVSRQLPRAQSLVLQGSPTAPAAFDIQLQWHDGRGASPAQLSVHVTLGTQDSP
jgi:Tfp pilus assembly protein PilV